MIKKITAFLKGMILSNLAVLAICMIIMIGLLITGAELEINNFLIYVYSGSGQANISIKEIPVLIIGIFGGIKSLKKYNLKLEKENEATD